VRIALWVRSASGTADRVGRPRSQVSATTERVVDLLRDAGATVDVFSPECRALDLGSLRKDKVVHTPPLIAAGVPTPDAWANGSLAALGEVADGRPLLVKPPAGSMAWGIERVVSRAALQGECGRRLRRALIDALSGPTALLAQTEAPSDGEEVKVYGVGDWVAATARPFPARSAAQNRGRSFKLTDEMCRAALTCGAALGLELYGADIVRRGDEFHVVDVNAYPSYQGVDEAPRRVAAYLIARAKGAG